MLLESDGIDMLSAVVLTIDSKDEYLVLSSSIEVFKEISIEGSILLSTVFLGVKFSVVSVGIFVIISAVPVSLLLTVLETVSMII